MGLDRKYWITSDSHFGHAAILDSERGSRFKTVQEHDDFILLKWDQWMTKCDKVDGVFVFLGDFGRPSADFFEKIKEVFESHSCEKWAVYGNHDKDNRDILWHLFDGVSEYPVYIDKRVILSHEPEACWPHQLNIHGHLHASRLADPQHICASVHMSDYNAITTDRITSSLGKLPKKDYRFLYEPWAADYVFTKSKKDVIKDKNGRIDLSASRLLHYLNAKERRECGEEYTADDFLADEVHFYG